MSKAIPKECMALLKEASEMFGETGCVPGIDGEHNPKILFYFLPRPLHRIVSKPRQIFCPPGTPNRGRLTKLESIRNHACFY